MELDDVGGFRRLKINSSKFKRLNLKNHRLPHDISDRSLEIYAPYLEHLEISGDLGDLQCRLVDVSSLVKAKFNGLLVPELKCKYLTLELCIENFDLNGVAGLLGALPHVETLNIYLTENLVTF
ncbi:hypothetical protein KY289_034895 [Solanum tuberosum]|nr:hypothetical protein KY289_034895 [Solanum tuberosum]